MNCPFCGKTLPYPSAYCPFCGKPLNASPTAPDAAPPAQGADASAYSVGAPTPVQPNPFTPSANPAQPQPLQPNPFLPRAYPPASSGTPTQGTGVPAPLYTAPPPYNGAPAQGTGAPTPLYTAPPPYNGAPAQGAGAPAAEPKPSRSVLATVTKILCYGVAAAFLVLLIRMAPGFGWQKVVSYAIGAAVTIGLAVLFGVLSRGKRPAVFYHVSWILAATVLAVSVLLRIAYEVKRDAAEANVLPGSIAHLQVEMKPHFYSYERDGYVTDPVTEVHMGTLQLQDGNIVTLRLDEPYAMQIQCGYGDTGGYVDVIEEITADKVRGGETFQYKVTINADEYAVVDLRFKRVCTFWEVILY